MTSKYSKDIEEIKETLAELKPVLGCVPALQAASVKLDKSVGELTIVVSTLHETCPYRDDIVLAKENHKKVEKVEEKAQKNEVGLAKIAASALGGGTVVALLQELLKRLPA